MSGHRSLHRSLGVLGVIILAGCGTPSTPAPAPQSNAAATANPTAVGPTVVVGSVPRVDSLLGAVKGKWVLVNVWATWCRPCVVETPDLVALHQSLRDKPFALVGVSADFMTSPTEAEALKKVRSFAEMHRMAYPNIIFSGSTDDLTSRFRLSGTIPASILYNPQGEEVERWIGRLAESDIEWIRSLVS